MILRCCSDEEVPDHGDGPRPLILGKCDCRCSPRGHFGGLDQERRIDDVRAELREDNDGEVSVLKTAFVDILRRCDRRCAPSGERQRSIGIEPKWSTKDPQRLSGVGESAATPATSTLVYVCRVSCVVFRARDS